MHLCIQNNGVTFPKNHISIGNQRFVLAFDQDDHGLAGDIQVTDTLAVPGIVFLQNYLFEIDMFVVLERFRPKDNGIIHMQHCIALLL